MGGCKLMQIDIEDDLRRRLRVILGVEPTTYTQMHKDSGISRVILSSFLNSVGKASVQMKTRCRIEKYIVKKEKELGVGNE